MKIQTTCECQKTPTAKEVSQKLFEGLEELRESLMPQNRLNVSGLMNDIIWGNNKFYSEAKHQEWLDNQSGVNE
jgi:hypothetical protein